MVRNMRLDLWALAFVIFAPVAIWLQMLTLTDRFANLAVTLTSFGQLSGIVGMTLVAIGMVFQLRLGFLARMMAKPTTVSNVHHNLGVLGLALLLLHPVFLAFRYIPISLQAAFNFIYQPTFVNFVGLVALILMAVAMIVTLFLPRSYVHWKGFHLVFVLAYLFSLYHLLFTVSDISRSSALWWYLIVIYLLGLTLFTIQKSIYLGRKYTAGEIQ